MPEAKEAVPEPESAPSPMSASRKRAASSALPATPATAKRLTTAANYPKCPYQTETGKAESEDNPLLREGWEIKEMLCGDKTFVHKSGVRVRSRVRYLQLVEEWEAAAPQ